jgi:glycopeptide antibiotics resistance protein
LKKEIQIRLHYVLLSIPTLIIGLASRKYGNYFPEFFATYGGDTLWTMQVYWMFRFLMPRKSMKTSFWAAMVFSFCIEFSQFYKAPWINVLRDTTFGALVLGRGFLLSDLVCYTVGAILAFGLDRVLKGERIILFK